MPRTCTWVVLLCACLLMGIPGAALAQTGAPSAGLVATAQKPAPGHPKARPLSPGEREVIKELSQVRTQRLQALRQEMHGIIDRAVREGKISAEQAELLKQHRRLPKHLRRHGNLPETGQSPVPGERVEVGN